MKNNITEWTVPKPTGKMEISQAYNGSYTREIRVYNKALTAEQVKILYDQQAMKRLRVKKNVRQENQNPGRDTDEGESDKSGN